MSDAQVDAGGGGSGVAASASGATAAATPSLRAQPAATLTHFPHIFEEEPEPGLLPSFLSKVKSTFAAATPIVYPPAPKVDKGSGASTPSLLPAQATLTVGPAKTEAQALAEAVRGRDAKSQPASVASTDTLSVPPAAPSIDAGSSTRSLHSGAGSAPGRPGSQAGSLMPPPSMTHSFASSGAPSVASSGRSAHSSQPPRERLWRPSGVAPAQVVLTPASRVTTVVQATGTVIPPEAARTPPNIHRSRMNPAFHSIHSRRTSFSSLNHTNARGRRSSIATIPDSPTSVSLSALIAANSELNQNPTYVPGFPLSQDDTRSVYSVGFMKKSNSVTRIIRRMRGEGLSKHYWMADEHCKECYECKSVS